MKPKRIRLGWTVEEEDIISANADASVYKLMELLPNRTMISVKSKVKSMGIGGFFGKRFTPEAMHEEKKLIIEELLKFIDLICPDKEARAKAIDAIEDAAVMHDDAWWWARRDWELGKHAEYFVDGYKWDKEDHNKRIVGLFLALKQGSFEQGVDPMIFAQSIA